MCAIKIIKNEAGMMLLNILFFILFLGSMGVALTTMVIADFKVQSINLDRPRALYAAHSGIDYATRGVLEYALSNSSLGGLHGYTETVQAGGNSTADITIYVSGTDSVTIQSVGYSTNFSQTLTKGLNYTDISNYTCYASGSVSNISSNVSGGIVQYASKMPVFDLDDLRNVAKPSAYFTGNLTISSIISYSSGLVFAEGNITFNSFNWLNYANFVSGGNITAKSSWWPLGLTYGALYNFSPGSQFNVQWRLFTLYLIGGLIVDGDVASVNSKFYIYHNRTRINSLLQYSVNGGPLVINNSNWRRQH